MASIARELPRPIVATDDVNDVLVHQVRGAADHGFAKLSDLELIEQLKQSSRHALGILFIRYRRLVLSVSVRILRDNNEAEDVVQDVFLEIWKKSASFDSDRGSVKMWILQYAYSRSLDRRRYLALRLSNGNGANGNGNWTKLSCAHDPRGLGGLTMEERGAAMRKALEALPERQKRVLELACFEGLLMAEIAETLNETPGNVRNLYYRGLKKLQTALSGLSK